MFFEKAEVEPLKLPGLLSVRVVSAEQEVQAGPQEIYGQRA
jgi:hypothetical protein